MWNSDTLTGPALEFVECEIRRTRLVKRIMPRRSERRLVRRPSSARSEVVKKAAYHVATNASCSSSHIQTNSRVTGAFPAWSSASIETSLNTTSRNKPQQVGCVGERSAEFLGDGVDEIGVTADPLAEVVVERMQDRVPLCLSRADQCL